MATTLTSDVAVVVDALPYIDHEYDESGVREAVSIRQKSHERRVQSFADREFDLSYT